MDYWFKGRIDGVSYEAFLTSTLQSYELNGFDINQVPKCGLIRNGTAEIAYSKWVTPKRTRTYPFERIYNTYNSSKILTVIPVIKDEGADGDFDRIQYSTISWMNLLNVYIVLGFYGSASKNNTPTQRYRQKLTDQQFDAEHVRAQIEDIFRYRQDALHWNSSLFGEHFIEIFGFALDAYKEISNRTGVQTHRQIRQRQYLDEVENDFEQFRHISLSGSRGAARREIATHHASEWLENDAKARFEIENFQGGVYHLTADEVLEESGTYVIQESKNSRGSLPSVQDIKDGLFKLILYSNLAKLTLDGNSVPFTTRLKLTGEKIRGHLRLPATTKEIQKFIDTNSRNLSPSQRQLISLLQAESKENHRLQIEVASSRGAHDD